ncbi:sperm-egg fusion protein TMEM95 [Crotalus tigris]|uniref:sperm-egg fusion protein TMEM95 n=1 Tax=Crotalus tigris TaxID=88082 RepID=UPI00192F316B|nr:sperm-egg fusion protein TMEM95 [Crotalus tigris]
MGGAEGCLHCGHEFKNLRMRFARLCARHRERFARGGCSKYPWGAAAVRDFALASPPFSIFSAPDEAALDLLLEKAHRVLRVIEIKQSFVDVPKFWNWLHEVKIPSETREEMGQNSRNGGGDTLGPVVVVNCCPFIASLLPDVAASLFNCSSCRRMEIPCWDRRICYPGFSSVRMLEGNRRRHEDSSPLRALWHASRKRARGRRRGAWVCKNLHGST